MNEQKVKKLTVLVGETAIGVSKKYWRELTGVVIGTIVSEKDKNLFDKTALGLGRAGLVALSIAGLATAVNNKAVKEYLEED